MKIIRVDSKSDEAGTVRRLPRAARVSEHGQLRAAQRNLSDRDLEEVLRLGRKIHRTGALYVFLGRRDVPDERRHDERLLRLVGTTLVLSADGATLITAYRDRGAMRKIRRKPKLRSPQHRRAGLAA